GDIALQLRGKYFSLRVDKTKWLHRFVEQAALLAIALRLRHLTTFAGIVDVYVILNYAFPGFRDVDLQINTIAPFITLNDSETDFQIVPICGLEFSEISAFTQGLQQKVSVLVGSRSLERRTATLPVFVWHE